MMISYLGLYEDYNWGASDRLYTGRGGDVDYYHSLFAFPELLGIPSGSTVDSAEAGFYCSGNSNYCTSRETQVRKVLVPWVEGSSIYAIETGASCWYYREHNTVAWNTAGCLGDGTDRVATPSFAGTPSPGNWFVASGSGMIADVQSTVDTGVHHGWLLEDDKTVTYSVTWYTGSEYADSAYRPYISVTYTEAVERSWSPFPMVRNI
jgi:hypothetical protein